MFKSRESMNTKDSLWTSSMLFIDILNLKKCPLNKGTMLFLEQYYLQERQLLLIKMLRKSSNWFMKSLMLSITMKSLKITSKLYLSQIIMSLTLKSSSQPPKFQNIFQQLEPKHQGPATWNLSWMEALLLVRWMVPMLKSTTMSERKIYSFLEQKFNR